MFVILGSILEASLAFTYNSVRMKLQHKFVRSCANMSRLHGASNAKDDDSTNDKEVTVSFKTADKTEEISINKGEILRSAMLKRGKSPHNGRARLINCRGLGTCGTCAVEITCTKGSENIPLMPQERNTKERLRLNFPPHGSEDQSSNLRLACQVQVQDDVTISKRTGFWGQDTPTDDNSSLAESYDAELWFGDLEYFLDDKSPKDSKMK